MTKRLRSLLLDCPLVFAAIFIAGIGGTFQYGFNLSCMTSPSLFIKELVNMTSTERYGHPLEEQQVSLVWSFMVSIFSVGGVLGNLLTSRLSKKYGRKQCLQLSNLVAILGAVLMLLSKRAVSYEMIMVARFLYGINSGIGMTVHSMYVVECAPRNLSGIVGVSIATFASMGKFVGQLLGIEELLGAEDRWEWLLGFSGFLALLQLCTLPLLPESPRYLLLNKDDRPGYERAVRRLWGPGDHRAETETMLQEKTALQDIKIHTMVELLVYRPLRWPALTIVILFTSMQLCGISVLYLYSLEVFSQAGIPENQLKYVSFGTGLCEVISSVCCVITVERIGRKNLLIGAYGGLGICQVLLIITLNLQDHVDWLPYCSIVLVFLSIFFYSSGATGVSLTLLAEYFTQSYKPAAYMLACSISWVGLFLLGMLFPHIVLYLKRFSFTPFLCISFATAAFVWFNVPDTSGLSPPEIQEKFEKMHSKNEKGQGCTATPYETANNNVHVGKCQTKL